MKKIMLSALIGISLSASAQSVQVLDRCEEVKSENGYWDAAGAKPAVDNDKKEGQFSVSASSPQPERLKKEYVKPFDTRVSKENGFLAFWLYVDNTDFLKGGNVCISSDHAASRDSYEYPFFNDLKMGDKSLVKGWNTVVLPLSAFKNVKGNPNLSAINYFRVVLYNKDESNIPQIIKLDNIRFSTDKAALEKID